MRCSVVIPTYERPALLERTLDALAVQTLAMPPARWSIDGGGRTT